MVSCETSALSHTNLYVSKARLRKSMTALRNSFHLHFEWIDHSEGVIGYGSNVVQNKIYFPRTRHNFLGPPCDVIRKDCEAAIAWFPKDSSEYLILRRRLYTVVQFAVKWSQDVESLAL